MAHSTDVIVDQTCLHQLGRSKKRRFAFFSRSNPDGEVVKPAPLSTDGTPLTKTEQVIAGAARGTKNIAGEIVSDAGNAVSGIGKVILYGIGVIIIIALLGSSPVLAFLVLGLGIYFYRKNR